MSTPIAATTHAVVWIDHHQATVTQIDAGPVSARHVKTHEHPTAQHGSEVRSVHEFFSDVCDAVDGMSVALVTGGKTALADFRHYAEKHRPHTAARIAAYVVVDHPTESQLIALGRKFFDL
jgi:stalled ribosome rescue protein Dom34